MTFPYPGDDPGALLEVAATFNGGQPSLGLVGERLGEAAASMRTHWQADSAQLANADLDRVQTVVAEAGRDLARAGSAVDAYRSALLTVRAQIDDLRARYAAAQDQLEAGQADAQRLAHADDQGATTPGQLAAHQAELSEAQATARHDAEILDEEYQRLVRRANAAAQECSAELLATIHGHVHGHAHVHDVRHAVNLDAALDVEVNEFGLVGADDARKAAALTDEITHLPPGDPKIAQLAAKLHAILDQDAGDPYFATPYLTKIGPDGLYALTAVLAGAGVGDPGDVGAIQRDLGMDLAAATRYADPGDANPQHVPQVPSSWIDELMSDTAHRYNEASTATSFGQQAALPLPGGQLLGVLLHTGAYSARFLGQAGDWLQHYEQTHGGDAAWPVQDPAAVGSPIRLWWGGGPNTPDRGVDPFGGWTDAMTGAPDAARTVLAAKPDLLNYLLNDRAWDSPDYQADPTSSDGVRHGLVNFGAMFDHVVGAGASDPQSRSIFAQLVHDLGTDQLNHRINAEGGFAHNDWIPPELRPFIGDVAVKNIDQVHQAMAEVGDPGRDDQAYARVIAELGKHQPSAAALLAAEQAYAGDLLTHDYHDADRDALASTSALLSYGHAEHNSAAQQAADTARNNMLAEITNSVQTIADTSLGAVPGAGTATGRFLALVTDALHQDHSAQTNAANADWYANQSQNAQHSAVTALYQSLPADALATSPNSQVRSVVDHGHLTPWDTLSRDQQEAVGRWTRDHRGYDLYSIADQIQNTIEDRASYAKTIGVT